MIQGNYFNDNKDIQDHFEKIINWNSVVEEYEEGFKDNKEYQKTNNALLASAPSSIDEAKEYYNFCLEIVGKLSGEIVAPRAAIMDKEGLKFEKGEVIFSKPIIECMEKAKEAGCFYLGISRHYGGLNVPQLVRSIAFEILCRADSSFAFSMSTPDIAEIIDRFSTEEVAKDWLLDLTKGKYWSAMALTEPNYGSDLPSITTKAEKNSDGTWLLNGTKRFITQACGFNGVPAAIITLARTGKPESGARGLSLFIVNSKDVEIAGIEKKLGLSTSPTCEVVYENAPGVIIGKEGLGLLKYAMGMMNTARISVAAQAMGVAQAAVSEAKKYASERHQFGRAIQDIPAVRKRLDFMDRELIAMRCILYEASSCIDLYQWRKISVEKEKAKEGDGSYKKDKESLDKIRKWEKLANFYTPLSKYYLSEMCNRIAYDALQVFGGSGYIRDYDIERIYRDARIAPIYEGTTNLQILAAIGGISAGMAPTGYLREYIAEEMKSFQASSFLNQVYDIFSKICNEYREIKDKDLRDKLSLEAVHSSARFLGGMLLERSLTKFSAEELKERTDMVEQFNIDSQAMLLANLSLIQTKKQKIGMTLVEEAVIKVA